jgi:hypothetical protein
LDHFLPLTSFNHILNPLLLILISYNTILLLFFNELTLLLLLSSFREPPDQWNNLHLLFLILLLLLFFDLFILHFLRECSLCFPSKVHFLHNLVGNLFKIRAFYRALLVVLMFLCLLFDQVSVLLSLDVFIQRLVAIQSFVIVIVLFLCQFLSSVLVKQFSGVFELGSGPF